MATGVSIAGSLLMPSDNSSQPKTPHPSLPDSSLDATLPTIFGTARVGGRFIYSTPTRRIAGQTSGKGGQPKQTQDSFIADALAYAFSIDNPVELDELYLNGELVYAPNSTNSLTVARSNTFAADHLTFFSGTTTQLPSTLLESFSGVGQVPAFRGVSYIVLRALNLGDYGNSYPQVVARLKSVERYSNAKQFLDKAIEFSGVNRDSQEAFGVDVLTIDSSVAAYPFIGTSFSNANTNIQGWIEPYIELYQLVLREDAPGTYTLTVPYDVTVATQNVVTIDALEILGVDGGKRYDLSNSSKDKVPSSVSLTYFDPLRELDENSITVYNTKSYESNDISVNLPYALSRNQAYSGAERLLRAAWSRRQTIVFSLPITSDFFLRIGSLVRFNNEPTIEGINFIVIEQTFSTNFFVEYTCVQLNRMAYAYNKNVLGTLFSRPVSLNPADVQNALVANIIDAPLVRLTDGQREGVYVAFELPNTTSAVDVQMSCDGGVTYNSVGVLNQSTITGVLSAPLPSSDYHIIDELNTIDVQLTDSTKALVSVTDTEFLNNEQILFIGGEYIAYRDATPLGNGLFRLSGLNRGEEGTEHEVKAHSVGEPISFLAGDSTNRPRITLDPNDFGVKLFKVLTVGNTDLDSAITYTVDYQGQSSKSLAPVEAEPALQSNGDWLLTFVDRSITDSVRFLQDGVPLPSNIDGNVFEIEIFNAGTLTRTQFITGNSYTYTLANQLNDIGAPVTEISFKVYQHRQSLPVGRSPESLNFDNSQP